MKVNILHLSDLHASQANKKNIQQLKHDLSKDIKKIELDTGLRPDMVFISGDLVDKGEHGDTAFDIVLDDFIRPLLKELGLNENRLFLTPGNHDVDRLAINETFENGIKDMVNTKDKFEKYMEDLKTNESGKSFIQDRLKSFEKFKSRIDNNTRIYSDFHCDCFETEINNLKIGIVSLNSVWRSSSFEPDEKKLIIGEQLVSEGIEKIENCDIKIALTHHPLEMLVDWDRESLLQLLARKINILCVGHIHSSDFNYTKKILGDLHVSTCSPLQKKKGRDNGYSFLSVNLEGKELRVLLRKYYDERAEFDQETERQKNGEVVISNFQIENEEKNKLIDILSLRTKLKKEIDDMNALLIPIDSIGIKELKFREVFVEPIINDTSNLTNKEQDKKKYELIDLIKANKNLVFFGGKEYGKTCLLKFIKNEILCNDNDFSNKISAFIKFSKISKNNPKSVTREIVNALNCNCTKQDVEKYLKDGSLILLIDDYNDSNDDSRAKRKIVFQKFTAQYPTCRYIFSMKESLVQAFKEESIVLDTTLQTEDYYLASYNTAKIRELLERWKKVNEAINVDEILQQIVYYFKQLKIPVTPMAVTLLMGVLFRDNKKQGIKNEGYLIEKYLDGLLEKIKHIDTDEDFDFVDKEYFLSHVAFRMAEKNKFEWTSDEFELEKTEYFKDIGDEVPNQKIFDDFFAKGILQEVNQMISFKHKFWTFFFIAKKMEKNPKAMQTLLSRKDFLKFADAFSYKAGLERNDVSLLSEIENRTMMVLEDVRDKYLNKDFIAGESMKMLMDVTTDLEVELKSKNQSEAKDKVSDQKYLKFDEVTQKIESDTEYDNIFNLVTLCSDIVRNTTQIKIEEKKKYLLSAVSSYVCLMWATVESLQLLIGNLNIDQVKQAFNKNYKEGMKNDEEIDITFEKIKKIVLSVFPLSVTLYMSDHLSNPRFGRALNELISEEKIVFRKVFLILLLVKVDLNEALKVISGFIEDSRALKVDAKTITYDFMIYQFLTIHSFETKIEPSLLEKVIKVMNKIRKKHTPNNQKYPPFIKNTFASDMKKSSLRSQQI